IQLLEVCQWGTRGRLLQCLVPSAELEMKSGSLSRLEFHHRFFYLYLSIIELII
ncbi:hypothetical protein Dimus_028781, partial [Dionaea muscipula]